MQDFLANVEEEVRQAVRRLAHHPSIVMWISGNENQVRIPIKLMLLILESCSYFQKIFLKIEPCPEEGYWRHSGLQCSL